MAPEGYLIDAVAQGIGDNLGPAELRRRAVARMPSGNASRRARPGRCSRSVADRPARLVV
jgi:hypothetical protein